MKRYIVKDVSSSMTPMFQVWDTLQGERIGCPVMWQDEAKKTADRLNWLDRQPDNPGGLLEISPELHNRE